MLNFVLVPPYEDVDVEVEVRFGTRAEGTGDVGRVHVRSEGDQPSWRVGVNENALLRMLRVSADELEHLAFWQAENNERES